MTSISIPRNHAADSWPQMRWQHQHAFARADSMLAVQVRHVDGAASIYEVVTVPLPIPDDGEVLIRVRSAGISSARLPQGANRRRSNPDIPGIEIAGEIVNSAGRWSKGDRVSTILTGGGYAQYAVCDARNPLPMPKCLSSAQAAGLPESPFAVYAGLFQRAALKSGDCLMLHDSTSNAGVAAIQMAKAAGAKVMATSRGVSSTRQAQMLGADVVIDTLVQDFADVARQQGGVDVVLNLSDTHSLSKDIQSIRPGGRLVYSVSSLEEVEHLELRGSLHHHAMLSVAAPVVLQAEETARLAMEIERVAWPWVRAGRLMPQIESIFPLREAAAAHAHLERRGHAGKVILSVD